MEYHSGGSLPLLGRPRYCPGANANGGYLCETGHCCGESGCCTYYYELWWFWLLWTVLILFSCCCAYRHRRAKLRVQQQQRQRDISLLAYQASSFPSSMLDLSFLASLKLPSYEEVAAQPSTPPPPYSSVFTAPRYPQPPRTADPHLLTQHPPRTSESHLLSQHPPHPGALLHRPLQALSDGPSSLSSDNSSSCSCDSCCPSSPCSSSLSAPVTYETDTSHTSTPSEATPLALDSSVTMETISAAADRLEPPRSSKMDDSAPAAVAILIEETNPAAATESATVVTAGSASPLETIASPNTTFPVGITPPIKQQLDIQTVTTSPVCSLQSTETSKYNAPMTSPPASLNLTKTLNSITSHTQPRTLNLILDCMGGNTDTNPSLVPISVSPQNPNRPISSEETCSSKPDSKVQNLTPENDPSNPSPPSRTLQLTNHISDSTNSPNVSDTVDMNSHQGAIQSFPSQGISHFSNTPATGESELNAESSTITNDEITHGNVEITSPAAPVIDAEISQKHQDSFESCKHTAELTKSTETVATNVDQKTVNIDNSTLQNSGISQAPQTLREIADKLDCTQKLQMTQAITPLPMSEMQNSTPSSVDQDSKMESPTVCQHQETSLKPTNECVTIPIPDLSEGLKASILSQDVTSKESNCQQNIASSLNGKTKSDLTLASDNRWSSLDWKTDETALSKSLPTESTSCLVVPEVHSLNLEHSFVNVPVGNENSSLSFFPAITIQADPTSPASPCSIPSPSLPSPPASMLLLDPLAALQVSEKSASSSGHASSLSPSPRNTQSPPKQTLFSPCVDVFEPVNPNWDEGESEEQADEEYCEDSDVAADESQYRHRRLTGDSGIEVCRCRVEDEDDDEEDEKEELKQDGGKEIGEKKLFVGSSELHDSVDCPVRSQKSGEELDLCNSETAQCPDEKVVISVETV